jgi:hypothetical protein
MLISVNYYSQGLLYISVAGIQITLLQCYIPHVDILIFFGKYFYHICLCIGINCLSFYIDDSTNLHD